MTQFLLSICRIATLATDYSVNRRKSTTAAPVARASVMTVHSTRNRYPREAGDRALSESVRSAMILHPAAVHVSLG